MMNHINYGHLKMKAAIDKKRSQETRTLAFASLASGTKGVNWSMCSQFKLVTAGSDTRLHASCKAMHGSFVV